MTATLNTPSGGSIKAGPAGGRIQVGVIAGAHGIRGQVRIKSFTERPERLGAYGPLHDETGSRVFEVSVVGRGKGVILCAIRGIGDRVAAEKLRGERLYLDRVMLPELAEDEFYHSDLIGLTARFADGAVAGRVAALYDFGAGDVMELHSPEGGVAVIPFTRASVPGVNLHAGEVIVAPLSGALEKPVSPAATGSCGRDSAGSAPEMVFKPAPAQQAGWREENWR